MQFRLYHFSSGLKIVSALHSIQFTNDKYCFHLLKYITDICRSLYLPTQECIHVKSMHVHPYSVVAASIIQARSTSVEASCQDRDAREKSVEAIEGAVLAND